MAPANVDVCGGGGAGTAEVATETDLRSRSEGWSMPCLVLSFVSRAVFARIGIDLHRPWWILGCGDGGEQQGGGITERWLRYQGGGELKVGEGSSLSDDSANSNDEAAMADSQSEARKVRVVNPLDEVNST